MLVSVLHTSLRALFPGERIGNVIDTSGEFLSDFFFLEDSIRYIL